MISKSNLNILKIRKNISGKKKHLGGLHFRRPYSNQHRPVKA